MSAELIMGSGLGVQSQGQQQRSIDGRVLPPSTQPTFKTDFKSNNNRDGGIMTTQHSLTLESYHTIMTSEHYNQAKFAPPPLVYAKDKRILIELAKAYGLRHGYRIVINKNDSRRVILLCSRHGTNKVSSRGSTSMRNKVDTSTFNGGSKSHKCQCPFRAEIQLKQRLKYWILKPIQMAHNHEEMIPVPVTVDNSTSSNLPSETVDGGLINKKYTISSFCDAPNHLNCFFETGDYQKLLGFDEEKTTMLHHDDGLRVITTELINNTTLGDHHSTSNSQHNSSTRKKRALIDTDNEQQVAAELLRVAKNARTHDGLKNDFTLVVKSSNPQTFFSDFPNMQIDDVDIRLVAAGIDAPHVYQFEFINRDSKLIFSEEVIVVSKETSEVFSQDLVKKINDIITAVRLQDENRRVDDLSVEDPDIANIAAVAVKATEDHNKESDLFVDPELTK